MPHWGIEPASEVCQSDALPTQLQPHPALKPQMAVIINLKREREREGEREREREGREKEKKKNKPVKQTT